MGKTTLQKKVVKEQQLQQCTAMFETRAIILRLSPQLTQISTVPLVCPELVMPAGQLVFTDTLVFAASFMVGWICKHTHLSQQTA